MKWRSVWRALQLGTPAVARTAAMARSLWTAIALGLTLGGTLVGQVVLRDPVTGLGLGLLALLAVLASAFGVAAARLVEDRERAETPVLLLGFDPDDETSHQEDWVEPAPRNWLAFERYRVRVTNTSARTIDAVTLSLVRFRPQGAAFLPIPLKAVGDDIGSRSVDVALHAGDVRYYEVAGLGFERDGRVKEIVLAYARSGVPNTINSGKRYELDLRVQGRDTPPTMAMFEVWVEDRRLRFAAAGGAAEAIRRDAQRRRDQQFANHLTERRKLAIDILNLPTNSPVLLESWKDASSAWYHNVLTLLGEHRCTPQQIASFESLGDVSLGGYDADQAINHLKSVHAEQIRRLERIIDAYSETPAFRR